MWRFTFKIYPHCSDCKSPLYHFCNSSIFGTFLALPIDNNVLYTSSEIVAGGSNCPDLSPTNA